MVSSKELSPQSTPERAYWKDANAFTAHVVKQLANKFSRDESAPADRSLDCKTTYILILTLQEAGGQILPTLKKNWVFGTF